MWANKYVSAQATTRTGWKRACRWCWAASPYRTHTGFWGTAMPTFLVHAIMDAMLGAAALGDIGQHFPSNDDTYKGISSIELLKRTLHIIAAKGFRIVNIDATLILQQPKVAPYIAAMRQNIAEALSIDIGVISVKATTTEGMGFEGTGEGASAMASVMLMG